MSGGALGREAIRAIRSGEVRDVLLALVDEGWQPVRWTGKCHLLLQHETGARITASSTASDRHAAKSLHRAARNAVARQRSRQS